MLTQAAGYLETIKAVEPSHGVGDQLRLVGLQRSNEVPLNGQVVQLRRFVSQLLGIIFPESLLAGLPGFSNHGHRFGFTHGEQPHAALRPVVLLLRLPDSVGHVL